MKLRLIIDLLAYSNENPTNDPKDAVKAYGKVEEDYAEVSRHFPRIIADGAVDEAVVLPDADSDYLVIFTDQTISIKLNGSADAITLNPKAPGFKTPAFVMRGSITALSISNSSGNSANVDITLVQL